MGAKSVPSRARKSAFFKIQHDDRETLLALGVGPADPQKVALLFLDQVVEAIDVLDGLAVDLKNHVAAEYPGLVRGSAVSGGRDIDPGGLLRQPELLGDLGREVL